MCQGFDGRDGIPGASGLPGPPGNVFIIDVSCFKTNFIVQAFGRYKTNIGYYKLHSGDFWNLVLIDRIWCMCNVIGHLQVLLISNYSNRENKDKPYKTHRVDIERIQYDMFLSITLHLLYLSISRPILLLRHPTKLKPSGKSSANTWCVYFAVWLKYRMIFHAVYKSGIHCVINR